MLAPGTLGSIPFGDSDLGLEPDSSSNIWVMCTAAVPVGQPAAESEQTQVGVYYHSNIL